MDKRNFIGVLEQDVQVALDTLDKEDTSYNRRVFVRTFYSFIEGIMHILRNDIVERAASKSDSLSIAEMAVLKEETYSVSSAYKVRTQEKHLKFDESFRLSIQYYFNVFDVDYGDGGWKAMMDGLAVRNRITHPKASSQLTISDQELETVKKAKD